MKLAAMFNDVLVSFFKKPVTQLYPFQKTDPPERLRGRLYFEPGACTGCNLCVKDCPANAIELVTLDRAAKRFVLKYHMDRCIYCGQCVTGCRFKCIRMSNVDWELASLKKDAFTVNYGKENDIAEILANLAQPTHEPDRD
ncbi:MAG TPA: 4Fe-4S binding protein [Anaerolineales bacterium]|nr:4Fe-4S binding protein [Anaerolineales bacterium]